MFRATYQACSTGQFSGSDFGHIGMGLNHYPEGSIPMVFGPMKNPYIAGNLSVLVYQFLTEVNVDTRSNGVTTPPPATAR
jgi:hypothetical protein